MRLTREEKETILLFNESDELLVLETYNEPLKKRALKFAKEYPNLFKKVEEKDGRLNCLIDKKQVSIRFVTPLSEEKRKLLAERLKKNLQKEG